MHHWGSRFFFRRGCFRIFMVFLDDFSFYILNSMGTVPGKKKIKQANEVRSSKGIKCEEKSLHLTKICNWL